MPEPVAIIGVGEGGREGLSAVTRAIVDGADELWGDPRLLASWPGRRPVKVPFSKPLEGMVQQLARRPAGKRIAVLASGDPGFYGIAALILKYVPAEEVQIYPQASYLQLAFARMRIPWGGAALTSAHARSITEVIGLAKRYPKLGILTDPGQSPSWIAERLLAAGIPDCRAVVLENLGEDDERIVDTRLGGLAGERFAPLNVMLLVHDAGWKPVPSALTRLDMAYQHKKGLITKRDVRVLSINRLQPRETDLIWDIGAGSGAVSIEMAEIAWRGRVYAIEKDAGCLVCLSENISRFGVENVEAVAGCAPEALAGLPSPDGIFIGGSNGKLGDILAQIERSARPGCRVVANFALLENLLLAFGWMQDRGWKPEMTEARFSYGKPTGGGTRLEPSNPVFILRATVQNKEAE